MAEGILFNVVEKLIGKLGSLAKESWNVRDDLGRLMDTMFEIKAVVQDAEEQQGTNHQVKVWVEKLKDAVDDADDLLDDFSTEQLRREVMTRDRDNIQDTCPAFPPQKQTIFINGLPCKNPANVTAQDFKTKELSNAGSTDIFGASLKIVTAAEFPGLITLGLSIGRTDIDVDGLVNFHYHPRAAEMIFITKAVLLAGFIDTQNQVFQKFLKVGDAFVFPKGLFHLYLNHDFEDATVFCVQQPKSRACIHYCYSC